MFFFSSDYRNEDQGLQLVLDWVQQDLQERRSKLHPLLGKYILVQLQGVTKKGSVRYYTAPIMVDVFYLIPLTGNVTKTSKMFKNVKSKKTRTLLSIFLNII